MISCCGITTGGISRLFPEVWFWQLGLKSFDSCGSWTSFFAKWCFYSGKNLTFFSIRGLPACLIQKPSKKIMEEWFPAKFKPASVLEDWTLMIWNLQVGNEMMYNPELSRSAFSPFTSRNTSRRSVVTPGTPGQSNRSIVRGNRWGKASWFLTSPSQSHMYLYHI